MSSNQRPAKAPVRVHGDHEVDHAELNPFSFREFVRNQGPNPGPDPGPDPEPDPEPDPGSCRKGHGRKPTFSEGSSFSWETLPSVLRDQGEQHSTSSLWLPDQEEEEEEEEEEDKASRSYHLARTGADDYEGDDETTVLVTPGPLSRKSQMQQLQEENTSLRRSIKDLRRSSSSYKERIQQLSEELVRRRHQEEKEAQALESMVHSVEQNLELMTKRAVKAEHGASRLKQELQQLQCHMEVIKSENERLLAEQSETITSMKRNALSAAERLGQTASQARLSIKQLLGEAENLHLVSQLLQSIDKISTSDVH